MLTLKTEPRDLAFSSGELNKFRSTGKIPANVYSKDLAPTAVFFNQIEFEKIFSAEGKVFEIMLDGNKILINAKEIQLNPVSKDILHVDFVKLNKGEITDVLVPVMTKNSAIGEKSGGLISIHQEKIKVSGIPSKIPSHLEVDISNLEINHSILIKDIVLLKGITIHESEDFETTIISCHPPRHQPTDVETKKDEVEPELVSES